MIADGTTAVQAFEAGEVDVNPNIPPEEIARIKETEDYEQYPGLGTYYYGFNTKNIPDVEPAPRDGARDQPARDHRQHRAGRPAADDGLHARGHAGLRHDQPGLAVDARERRPRAGEAADGRRCRTRRRTSRCCSTTRRATARSRSRSRRPGRSSGSTSRSSSRSGRSSSSSSARRRTTRSTSTGSAGSATTSTRSTSSSSGRATRATTRRTTATRSTTRWSRRRARRRTTTRATSIYAQLEEMLLGEDGEVPILADLLVHVHPAGARVDQGHVQQEPPRPDRPDGGRGRGGLERERDRSDGAERASAPPVLRVQRDAETG